MILVILLYLIPIALGILPFLVKLKTREKRNLWLTLSIGNLVFYHIPIVLAYFYSMKTGLGIFHSNGGFGALTLYIIVWPLTVAFGITIFLKKQEQKKG
ncbi:MAG: hypothetical protein Crog4KO_06000 [Crocinitomicaceae bacterium]